MTHDRIAFRSGLPKRKDHFGHKTLRDGFEIRISVSNMFKRFSFACFVLLLTHPQEGVVVAQKQRSCSRFQVEGDCTSDECVWCDEISKCRGTGTSAENVCTGGSTACARISDSTGCDDEDTCAWCPDQQKCRKEFLGCEPAGGSCRRIGDEATCVGIVEDECQWCSLIDKCAEGTQSCDAISGGGGGGGGSCKNVIEAECSGDCAWCAIGDRCIPAAVSDGVCREGGISGNPCRLEDTIQGCDKLGTVCQWSLKNDKCLNARAKDDDEAATGQGGGNENGNPCRNAFVESECLLITGEMDEEVCQFCSEQSKCKRANAMCDYPSGEADVELEGMGGGFAVQDDGLGPTDANRVSLVLNKLSEVGMDGAEVDPTHSVNLEDKAFNITQVLGVFFGGITARRISFSSTVNGVGNIKLEAFQIRSNGTITNDGGESWTVNPGDIKFNIVLTDWAFCGDAVECDGGAVGEYIDVAVEIKGRKNNPEKDQDDELSFDLGGNVPLKLSTQVLLDGVSTELPDGFPSVETDGDKTLFFFRIPRFVESAVYDPVIEFSEANYDDFLLVDDPDDSSGFTFGVNAIVGWFVAAVTAHLLLRL
jgi:hypothetical protein